MLAFIIALLIVVIIGSIVYGIYKLIVGISKFGFVQSLSTKKNRCDPPHQQRGKSRRFYENTYDDEDFEDIFAEKMFENTLDDDIFENDDGPSQTDKDKLVTARLERFHLSEDEAELIFGKEWRDILGQEYQLFFYHVAKLKNKLMETGLFDQI